MDWKELRAWIRDVGFPIVVALFVLVRLDSQFSLLVQETIRMRSEVAELVRLVEQGYSLRPRVSYLNADAQR